MKIFSAHDRNKPVDRARAINCFVINQFATPGLGSWLARRTVAAIGQLTLAFAGFFVLIACIFQATAEKIQAMMGEGPAVSNAARLGKIGGILFGAAWLWSGVTSISVWLEARRNERQKKTAPPIDQPPVI